VRFRVQRNVENFFASRPLSALQEPPSPT
jgi:hypothetical protein